MANVMDQTAPIPLKSLHCLFLELALQEQKNIEQDLTVYRVKISKFDFFTVSTFRIK